MVEVQAQHTAEISNGELPLGAKSAPAPEEGKAATDGTSAPDGEEVPAEDTTAEKAKRLAKKIIPHLIAIACIVLFVRSMTYLFKDEIESFFE